MADRDEDVDAALAARDREIWRAQYRDTARVLVLSQALIAEAAERPAWQAVGWCHIANVHLRSGRPEEGRFALARAEALCATCDASTEDPPPLDRLRDMQAVQLRAEQRHAEALALLEPRLALDETQREIESSVYAATVASQCCMSLGLLDRSLELRYRALRLAETLGDPAVLANCCANLAGVHNDVLNVEDGRALAARGLAAADDAGLQGVTLWLTSAFNLAVAQLLGHEGTAALATVRRMQAHAVRVPAAKRGRYEVLWATAALQAGEADEALHWLEAARARWHDEAEVIIEWQVTRAMLHNARGEWAAARAVCEAAQAQTLSGGDEVLPVDLMQLAEEGARACEALGDWRAALDWRRTVFAQYDLLAGRSARARRVATEIQHALDIARRDRDEAQRRRAAAELERQRLSELNEALHQAGEARTRFLAAASHDLRQPLHALSLQAERLSAALQGRPEMAVVERLQHSVAALTGMFDSLLDLSRIEAGAVEPQWETVDLPALLGRLVEEHLPEAERRGLRLALRVPPSAARLQLRSDPVLLDRLLRNLIGNALKYTPSGGVLVALRRGLPGQAARWRLQVIDTGLGIAPDERQRIFEAFYQVGGPGRTREQGLGLGLSIVLRLSQLLDLPLHLRSTPGRGSCFGVLLSADAKAADAPNTVAASLTGPDASPATGSRRRRIAVAEDDAEVREAWVRQLRALGCDVLAAGSGDALLEAVLRAGPASGAGAHSGTDSGAAPGARPAAASGAASAVAADETAPGPQPDRTPHGDPDTASADPPFDALITDGHMPGRLDGLALARAWRERFGAQAPVLVVSGDPTLPARAAGLAWLPKPLDPQRLRDWLQRLA